MTHLCHSCSTSLLESPQFTKGGVVGVCMLFGCVGWCCLLLGGGGVDVGTGWSRWPWCVVFVCGCVVLFVGVCGVKRSDTSQGTDELGSPKGE